MRSISYFTSDFSHCFDKVGMSHLLFSSSGDRSKYFLRVALPMLSLDFPGTLLSYLNLSVPCKHKFVSSSSSVYVLVGCLTTYLSRSALGRGSLLLRTSSAELPDAHTSVLLPCALSQNRMPLLNTM